MSAGANNAEGGSNGVTVTVGNSGGGSGAAFNSVIANGASTITFDNSNPAHGTFAYKLACANTQTTYLGWTFTAAGTIVVRAYIYIGSLPGVQVRLFDIRNTTPATTLRLQTNSANKFEIQEGGTGTPIALTSGIFSANTWYRWETYISALGAGSAHYVSSIYVGDTTPGTFATVTRTTAQLGTANMSALQIGNNTGPAFAGNIWLDDLQYDTTASAFFGPVSNPALTAPPLQVLRGMRVAPMSASIW